MPVRALTSASSGQQEHPPGWLMDTWPVLGRMMACLGLDGRPMENYIQTLAALCHKGEGEEGAPRTVREALLQAAALRGFTFDADSTEVCWVEAVLDAGLVALKSDTSLGTNTYSAFASYALEAGSAQKIAKRYGTSENAIYQIKNRGLRRLRSVFDQLESVLARRFGVPATGFPATSAFPLDRLRRERPGAPLAKPEVGFLRRVGLVTEAARLRARHPVVAWRSRRALHHRDVDGPLLFSHTGRNFALTLEKDRAVVLLERESGGGVHAQPGPSGEVLLNGRRLTDVSRLVQGDVLESAGALLAFSAS